MLRARPQFSRPSAGSKSVALIAEGAYLDSGLPFRSAGIGARALAAIMRLTAVKAQAETARELVGEANSDE